ncbi:neuropilin and tolloid-like protein 2 [Daphnia pulicaria]|uniref:neuropilin and tolloid-like protein 2 n=1 Tax=Daphnia pulicaria TaxID=35523 RepID=UPI001EEA68F8|nr:neuropilin and tolloid-like protein 2 [Daphnia pulicaria]
MYLNCVELFLGDCGSCKNVTEDGGIFESPNFPDEYSSNLCCLFTINAPPEKKINLTFTEVSVKECCDFITVFDGFANPLRVSLNGYDSPADVISPSSQMAVKFSSNDENITEFDATKLRPVSRWQATFTFV